MHTLLIILVMILYVINTNLILSYHMVLSQCHGFMTWLITWFYHNVMVL